MYIYYKYIMKNHIRVLCKVTHKMHYIVKVQLNMYITNAIRGLIHVSTLIGATEWVFWAFTTKG